MSPCRNHMGLLLLLLVFPFSASSLIGPGRQLQLDSLISNMEKDCVRNIDSAHSFMHRTGATDEERVWLFYGFIATHCGYDNNLLKQKGRKLHTPAYTCEKRRGVCMDFSELMLEFCQRSHIPCLIVFGTGKKGFFGNLWGRLFDKKYYASNHAWNMVKYNNTWHHMDVTWSSIKKVERFYSQEGSTKKLTGRAKISSRDYYDTDAFRMQKKHIPLHPAFLGSQYVATWRSVGRKHRWERTYDDDYDWRTELDSIYGAKGNMNWNRYFEGIEAYSGRSEYAALSAFIKATKLLERRTTKTHMLTRRDYDRSLKAAEGIGAYMIKIGYKPNYVKQRLATFRSEISAAIKELPPDNTTAN